MAEIDIQAEAGELLIQAASQVASADPEQLAGAQRLLPKLLAAADDPKMRAAFSTLGEKIAELVDEFLLELGDGDLVDDFGATGFVACAALAYFGAEETGEH